MSAVTHPELPNLPGSPLELSGVEKALLALSYGVHVIGSRAADGTLNAMLADWVMQVSFKPRLLAVSIENDARTLRFIKETRAFTVNLLHEKDGIEIARKVVMPSEASKIRGAPKKLQQRSSTSWPPSLTACMTTAARCSTRRSAGSPARLSRSMKRAITPSSSGHASTANASAPAKCSSNANWAGSTGAEPGSVRLQCISAGTYTAERNHAGRKPQRRALFIERTLVNP